MIATPSRPFPLPAPVVALARLALVGALMTLATACATTPPVVEPTGTPMKPGIYRVSDGSPVTPEALFDELEAAPVVYIGETHDKASHHEVQALIVEELSRRAPGRVAVGMEMFQTPFQGPLDDYTRRLIDEAQMLEKTEYQDRWGYDFSFYRPLVAMMRLQGSFVIALNAPKELTRKISKEGLEALDQAERDALPSSLDADNPDHRQMFIEAMGSFHGGMDEGTFARYYAAQRVWDSVMAQSLVAFLKAHPQIERVVVVAGVYHVRNGLGIPFHARAQGELEGRIVIPIELDPADLPMAEDIIGSGVGDFVWIVEPAKD